MNQVVYIYSVLVINITSFSYVGFHLKCLLTYRATRVEFNYILHINGKPNT